MSQIFDALHEFQRERAGSDPRDFSAAKELLEVVERKAGSPRALVPDSSHRPEGREFVPTATPATDFCPDRKLVCLTQSESLAAEKFRFLAIRLRHLQQKRPVKRILITSSVAAEGKSMVAGNLACALAAGKQQVLLLDGDLRRPWLARQFGLGERAGLSELLENGSGSSHNVYKLEGSGLCVLPAGVTASNPLELMQLGKLSAVMDRLSASFDWIVIDSPPLLPLADTSIWMRLADTIILVTRPGMTEKRQLQRALEMVEHSKLLGAVLNASSEATAGNYYYHRYTHSAASQAPTPSAR